MQIRRITVLRSTAIFLLGLLPFMCDARNPGVGFVIYGLSKFKLNQLTCSVITVNGRVEPATAFMSGANGKSYFVCDVLSRRSSKVALRVRSLPSNKTTLSQECKLAIRRDLNPEVFLQPMKVIEDSTNSGCLFVTDVVIEESGAVLRLTLYCILLIFVVVGVGYVAKRFDLMGKLSDRCRAHANWDQLPLEVRNPVVEGEA